MSQDETRRQWMDGVRHRAVAAWPEHAGAINAGVQSDTEKAFQRGWLEGHMLAQEELVWGLAQAIMREYVATNWPDEDTFCNQLIPEVLSSLNDA